MNILSYRGPDDRENRGFGLARLFSENRQEHQWWFLDSDSLECRVSNSGSDSHICEFPRAVVQGHSDYCGDFLAPLFNEQKDRLRFDQSQRQMYHQFNTFFSQSVLGFNPQSIIQPILIHGHHLALSPQILFNCSGSRSTLFWTLPWPKYFERAYRPFVSEIALGLLHANHLGFSKPEFAENFLKYVQKSLPSFDVDIHSRAVESSYRPDHSTLVGYRPFGSDFCRN